MRFFGRLLVFFCVLFVVFCSSSCEKKKEGKVIITEQEFVLRQDTDHSFVVDARGKVKNVGDVDVKKVVVTGYCRSCGEVILPDRWFVSNTEKTTDQQDIISYVAAGVEEEVNFREVAFYYGQVGIERPEMPEHLEFVIESFETVNN